jgi:hypothetical protein
MFNKVAFQAAVEFHILGVCIVGAWVQESPDYMIKRSFLLII